MKRKSTIWFIICVVFIGLLAYTGAKGLTISGYHFKSFGESIKRGLDLKGGVSVVEEIQETNYDGAAVSRTIELLNKRVNKLGVAETVVQKEGEKRIRIDIPGESDTKKVVESVAKTGKLTFVGPDKVVILSGSDIKDSSAYLDSSAKPVVSLELTSAGAKKFAAATQKFLNQAISIYMDSDLVSAPTVDEVISDGKAVINNIDTEDEAKSIASMIKSGSLPVTLKTVSAKVVGPSLGQNAMPQSLMAGAVGIGLVLLFMLVMYRMLGVTADIALIFYITILLGTFATLGVTLTLPGIAGFLLTIGMAVDANVLIFERIKEELRAGKSVKTSIDAGFHRAMSSILDSNITTIISGFVLYFLGTGGVKGFALTLITGVILSMLTAIFVTRLFINLMYRMGWFNKKWAIGTFEITEVE
ncbi:MAG: protein translocase subunit SecD [Clostridiaceae bacterium]